MEPPARVYQTPEGQIRIERGDDGADLSPAIARGLVSDERLRSQVRRALLPLLKFKRGEGDADSEQEAR
jgi:hypothetical protein